MGVQRCWKQCKRSRRYTCMCGLLVWSVQKARNASCWLQVARHDGNTIAFHMKNYGNFTKVGAQCITRLVGLHCSAIA
jgi:hypothetical protein